MAEIDRFDGNLRAFGADAISTERTVFGDVTQSDTLDDNINSDFFRGWGIVGPSENPTKQDFNAMGFTFGQLLAYLFQRGVAEWNVAQEYYAPAIVTHAGGLWLALSDNTGSEPPSADWTRVDPGGLWKFTGVISPAQITGNQDNYNPTGLAGAFTVRLDAVAARNITGLAGGEPGRVIELRNVSAFPITLVNESGSSSAANRFALGANALLQPNRSALLIYDGTLSRWRSIVAIDDLANYLQLSGGTMTGPIAMGSNKITGLADGTNSGDAVNKGQLDLKANLASPALTGTPTAPTAAVATDTTQVATTEFVKDASLGWGQTWQNVTGSRAAETDYTNTTGKPIEVAITLRSVTVEMRVDGVPIARQNFTNSAMYSTTSFTVPPGSVYRLHDSVAIIHWAELR